MAKQETAPAKDVSKTVYETMYKKAKAAGKEKQVSVDFYNWEQEGQILVGRLIDSEETESDTCEGKYNKYTFDTDLGLVGVICGKMFDLLVEDKKLIGKVLSIEYLGKRDLKGGKTVNRYKVFEIPEG